MSTCFDTAINSYQGNGINRYNVFTIQSGCNLYHGSPRLKYIQDYLTTDVHYLIKYLSVPNYNDFDFSLETDLSNKIKKILSQYVNWIPQKKDEKKQDEYNMYSKEIVVIEIIKLLDENGYLSTVSYPRVSKIILHYASTFPVYWQHWFNDSLISWLSKLEDAHSMDVVSPKYLSVMRQPVQYFGTEEDTQSYSGGIAKYRFTLTKDVQILNLDNFDTLKFLQSYVFTSNVKYTEEEIMLYTEQSPNDLSGILLVNFFEKTKNDILEWKKEHSDVDYTIYKNNYISHINKQYGLFDIREEEQKRLNKFYFDESLARFFQSLGVNNWSDYVSIMINRLMTENYPIYEYLLNSYHETTSNGLIHKILEEFPEVTKENMYDIRDKLNGYYYNFVNLQMEHGGDIPPDSENNYINNISSSYGLEDLSIEKEKREQGYYNEYSLIKILQTLVPDAKNSSSENWKLFLTVMINRLKVSKTIIFTYLLNIYHVNTSEELLDAIIKEYPQLNMDNIYDVRDKLNGYYWKMEDDIMTESNNYAQMKLTESFTNLKKIFEYKFNDENEVIINKYIDDLTSSFDWYMYDVFANMTTNWSKLFKIELLSPLGIFTYIFRNYFARNNSRISTYQIDSLMTYTLFSKIKADGFYSKLGHKEIMLYHPEEKGYSMLM
jgi:hypothetical protein